MSIWSKKDPSICGADLWTLPQIEYKTNTMSNELFPNWKSALGARPKSISLRYIKFKGLQINLIASAAAAAVASGSNSKEMLSSALHTSRRRRFILYNNFAAFLSDHNWVLRPIFELAAVDHFSILIFFRIACSQ